MDGIGIIISLLFLAIFLMIVKSITKKSSFNLIFGFIVFGCIFLYVFYLITNFFTTQTILEKSDFYGEYIIDRNYFSKEQADWQYNNFRFEIKENDSIFFYDTDEEIINKTYKGKFSTRKIFTSERPKFEMTEPNHHILTTNPTVYREIWSFILVFDSPKFSNMYFRKGKWKKIK